MTCGGSLCEGKHSCLVGSRGSERASERKGEITLLVEARPKGKTRTKDRDQWETLLMKRRVTLKGGGGRQTRQGTINNRDVIVTIVPMITVVF